MISRVIPLLLACGLGCAMEMTSPRSPSQEPKRGAAGGERLAQRLEQAALAPYSRACGAALDSVENVETLTPRARAWKFICEVHAVGFDHARKQAQNWAEREPRQPWAHFALAAILLNQPETRERGLIVLQDVPTDLGDGDGLRLHVGTHIERGQDEAARALLEKHGSVTTDQPELRVLALALDLKAAQRLPDDAYTKAIEGALADARAIQKQWPGFLEAYRIPAEMLIDAPPELAPIEMARTLADKAPDFARGAWLYWRYLLRLNQPQNGRKSVVDAEIQRSLAAHDGPEWLANAASIYRKLGMKRKSSVLEQRIVREHPDTIHAEVIIYERLRKAGEQAMKVRDTGDRNRRIERWRSDAWGFLRRPNHHMDTDAKVASALFFSFGEERRLTRDQKQQLLDLAEIIQSSTAIDPQTLYVKVPRVLVDKAGAFAEAEQLARSGLLRIEDHLPTRSFSDAERKAIAKNVQSSIYATIGWIAAKQENLPKAIDALNRSVSRNPDNAKARISLASYLQAMGHTNSAEKHLIHAYQTGTDDERMRAERSLRRLLASTGRSQEVDAFIHQQRAQQRERRKSEVLNTRIKGPALAARPGIRPLRNAPDPAFRDGQIVVVNVWATWCKPCLEEMPDLVDLAKIYATDPEVSFFTVSVDENPGDALRFLDRNGYDLPVYADAGLKQRMGIEEFPTTLVFDPSGHLAFRTTRIADPVVQEIAWRIDALR